MSAVPLRLMVLRGHQIGGLFYDSTLPGDGIPATMRAATGDSPEWTGYAPSPGICRSDPAELVSRVGSWPLATVPTFSGDPIFCPFPIKFALTVYNVHC